MSDVEVRTIVPILGISEKGYSGFKNPNGKIFVPGLVEDKHPALDSNKDYSSSILPTGGFIASRNGADQE